MTPIGPEVANYKIIDAVGRGGMGEVYLAKDTRLDRRVALKVLSRELAADAVLIKRFLREARMAASLSHPNIVSIYEVGEERGLHFIATEYIEGTTLRERMRHGPLDGAGTLFGSWPDLGGADNGVPRMVDGISSEREG